MSAFHHNSRAWEKIALAWHVFGAMVSIFGFVSAVAAIAVLFAVRPVIEGFLPELYLTWLWLGVMALVIWAAGIFFHLWAAVQHVDHMKALRHDGD